MLVCRSLFIKAQYNVNNDNNVQGLDIAGLDNDGLDISGRVYESCANREWL